MSKHIHAELMVKYAQDAMETEEPWVRWEVTCKSIDFWVSMTQHPLWETHSIYRRKRKTHIVHGKEVAAPLKEAPPKHQIVYLLAPSISQVYSVRFDGIQNPDKALLNGMVFATKEDAEENFRAYFPHISI